MRSLMTAVPSETAGSLTSATCLWLGERYSEVPRPLLCGINLFPIFTHLQYMTPTLEPTSSAE